MKHGLDACGKRADGAAFREVADGSGRQQLTVRHRTRRLAPKTQRSLAVLDHDVVEAVAEPARPASRQAGCARSRPASSSADSACTSRAVEP